MAQIIPIRDLKNTAEIYERCTSSNEPIFITKNGYGLFTRKGMVQELMALPGEEKALLLQMQRAVSPHTLTLRLPVKSPLFPGKGTVCPHGMLRPLCREVVRGFPADGTPYLGLTME